MLVAELKGTYSGGHRVVVPSSAAYLAWTTDASVTKSGFVVGYRAVIGGDTGKVV